MVKSLQTFSKEQVGRAKSSVASRRAKGRIRDRLIHSCSCSHKGDRRRLHPLTPGARLCPYRFSSASREERLNASPDELSTKQNFTLLPVFLTEASRRGISVGSLSTLSVVKLKTCPGAITFLALKTPPFLASNSETGFELIVSFPSLPFPPTSSLFPPPLPPKTSSLLLQG